MTAEELVAQFVGDGVEVIGGRIEAGCFITEVARLSSRTADLDSLTAEAFNQDVFPLSTKWEEGRAKIEEALLAATPAPPEPDSRKPPAG